MNRTPTAPENTMTDDAETLAAKANRCLGKNLRTLRKRKLISQVELAQQMSARGWPYHQQTIYKIETGRRRISFAEAIDLAAFLAVSLDQFTQPVSEESSTDAFTSYPGADLKVTGTDGMFAIAEAIRDLAATVRKRGSA
jgi:transcriptional regulator with XRE-family HTH domain